MEKLGEGWSSMSMAALPILLQQRHSEGTGNLTSLYVPCVASVHLRQWMQKLGPRFEPWFLL